MASRETTPVKHLFFDLDGTLTDPREGIVRSFEHALTRLGRPSPGSRALERCIGQPLTGAFRELLDSDREEPIREAIAYHREYFAERGIFENRIIPGIPQALRALDVSERRLCVVTTKPTAYAQRILNHFELGAHFRSVYGAELDGSRSEKADLVADALAAEGLEAADVWMVGDREFDVLGSRAHGVACIAVTWGFGSREELEAARPDVLVDDVPALVARVGGDSLQTYGA